MVVRSLLNLRVIRWRFAGMCKFCKKNDTEMLLNDGFNFVKNKIMLK